MSPVLVTWNISKISQSGHPKIWPKFGNALLHICLRLAVIVCGRNFITMLILLLFHFTLFALCQWSECRCTLVINAIHRLWTVVSKSRMELAQQIVQITNAALQLSGLALLVQRFECGWWVPNWLGFASFSFEEVLVMWLATYQNINITISAWLSGQISTWQRSWSLNYRTLRYTMSEILVILTLSLWGLLLCRGAVQVKKHVRIISVRIIGRWLYSLISYKQFVPSRISLQLAFQAFSENSFKWF